HWLSDPKNPLVARVAVNRFWKHLFGAGLVKTLGDFGTQGASPSHPELLDWLTVEFVENGWDVKKLLKTMVLSATFRQLSVNFHAYDESDPYNRMLSRAPRFRLSAEAVRDSALAVSGLLNPQIGGPSVRPYQPKDYYADKIGRSYEQSTGENLYRRGLYTYWRRTTLYPTFQIFDAPSREVCTVNRPRTNTPLQALVLMNDPTFVEAGRVFGQRILIEGGKTDREKLIYAFRTAVSRFPTQAEATVLQEILAEQRTIFGLDLAAAEKLVKNGESLPWDGVDPAELAAWTSVGSVLLNLDEAITRE
ncbi:MAG: DUF1553 domain-containing protein, partial [Pirellulaceae bacterium]|nr:DUF1553 domain-containing protein [Pirellulaceae bacterium]